MDRELERWTAAARRIPDGELRKQALASLSMKRFHCIGGAVFALLAPARRRSGLVPLIVALQTISDYLDNLCDRSTSMDPGDFRQLHLAMMEAVDPALPLSDYYALRAERDDGGYLRGLVEACRGAVAQLPAYGAVKPYVRELVEMYAELQVRKHIRPREREQALLSWWEEHRAAHPELRWNEFAAATGSTLGMFCLFAAAADEGTDEAAARQLKDAYFPYVCALHILLDYLIDAEEDRIGGDLNFCGYFTGAADAAARIAGAAEEARRRVGRLKDATFHAMIVEGLFALYLTDPKVERQPEVAETAGLLARRGSWIAACFRAASRWIRKKQGIAKLQMQEARS